MPIRSVAAPSSGASLAKTFAMSNTPFDTPGSTAGSPELSFAQKMAARLRSGGPTPAAGVNVGGTPVEGESLSSVPAGLLNLFAGGWGRGLVLVQYHPTWCHRGMPITPFWGQSTRT